MKVELRGNHFELLPSKAIYWEETKTFLLADLHLGKITHFRKEGLAIPTKAFENNFTRLDALMTSYDIKRMLILGDLFHSGYNTEWKRFESWRRNYPELEILVVLGNHDVLPGILYQKTGLIIHDHYQEGPFLFTHHPLESTELDHFVFSGHVHPVFCLSAPGRQSLRLPCFSIDTNQMILPSFGVFTGGYEMNRQVGRRIMVIGDNKVFEI